MSALDRSRKYYDQQQAVAVDGLNAVRRQVREHPLDLPGFVSVLTGFQIISATTASRTLADEAGRAPYANPLALGGRTSAGVPLVEPARTLLDDLAEQMSGNLDELTSEMLDRLERMAVSEIVNAGRDAASIEITSEPVWTNYVRVLRPPSCARCAILAGRIYRDNEGFLRHPRCDCEHWPVESWDQAHDEGLLFSAQDAFDRGEIRGLSRADEQAIRDGADISQVVNATSGMYTTSVFGRNGIKVTGVGTTKRSAWRKANPNLPVRLRPESINELAEDREDRIRLYKLYGYYLPGADVPADDGRAGGSGGGIPPLPPKTSTPGNPDPDDGQPDHVIGHADQVMANARMIEPDASSFVDTAAAAGNGRLERTDSRLKTRASVIEKLIRFGPDRRKVVRQARKMNDALRYTAVLDFSTYAEDLDRILDALNRGGYRVLNQSAGWFRTGYKGINVTVRAPNGISFEVQFHTVDTLRVSEEAHGLYEEQRKHRRGSRRWAELKAMIDAAYERIPVPPGIPEVD